MSAADTVKDVVRIATTAGLAKDVIDLLQAKTTLLTEQVAALQEENTTLLRENRNLATENQQLKTQLQNARPKGDGLEPKTQEILKYFFDNAREISVAEIARRFNMNLGVANYHTDALSEKKLISYCSVGMVIMGGFGDDSDGGDDSMKYDITAKGRKYVFESGLAR